MNRAESLLEVIDLGTVGTGSPVPAQGVPDRFGSSVLVARCSDPEILADPSPHVERALHAAALTLVEFESDDLRTVQVTDADAEIVALADRVSRFPLSARICDDVLRANADPGLDTALGLTVESLGYSTLQGGPEFARWLAEQPPRRRHKSDTAVLIDRTDDTLILEFNRPDKHNAFSNALRAGLLDALSVVLADPSITTCVFRGAGPSFCSGGDLREFGLFDDVAASHVARTRFSPAMMLDLVRRRLGSELIAQVQGAVMGSGLEMAAYCGTVRADPAARFALPELRLGLIPGAGGTVSVTRRIGRWRTAYLVFSGAEIDASTALRWGLIDEVVDG